MLETTAPASARAAAGTVALASPGELKISVRQKEFKLGLHLEELRGARTRVAVEVSRLTGPDGAEVAGKAGKVDCTLGSQPCAGGVDLAPLGQIALTLAGVVEKVASYSLVVAIVTLKERSSTRITVARE